MNDTMPGDAEAAAAAANLHEQTISPCRFAPGQHVRVPKAFGCGHQVGTVHSQEHDRHVGLCYLVDTQEGRLRMLPDELEAI